jgi:hypothetical protein
MPAEDIATKVFTPAYELRKRIKLLNRRLNMAYKVPGELAKAQLTINLINKIMELEEKLEKLEAPPVPPSDPPAETTDDKLKLWNRSRI